MITPLKNHCVQWSLQLLNYRCKSMATVCYLPSHGVSDETANHRRRIASSSWKAQGHHVETNLSAMVTSAVLLSTESQPDRNVLREGQTTYEYTKQTKDSQTKACLHRIKLRRSTALVSNHYFVELIWISRDPINLDMTECSPSSSTLHGEGQLFTQLLLSSCSQLM